MALLVGQRIASSFSSFQLIHRCVNVRSSAGQIHKLAEDRCRNTIGLENIQRRMFEARKCSQQARESVDLLQLKAKNSRGSLSESQIDLETERFEKKRQEEGLETAKRKAEHLKAEKEGSVVGKLHLELQEYKEILKCSIRLDRPKEYQSCYCAISCKSNCNCNLAVVLGFMSVAVLLAEATLLPSNVNLSLFSFLIKSAGKQELLVQVLAFIPLMYMCICTYYSLFKIGMLMFYSLTPGQTSSVSMLMICSMVARYATPILQLSKPHLP